MTARAQGHMGSCFTFKRIVRRGRNPHLNGTEFALTVVIDGWIMPKAPDKQDLRNLNSKFSPPPNPMTHRAAVRSKISQQNFRRSRA